MYCIYICCYASINLINVKYFLFDIIYVFVILFALAKQHNILYLVKSNNNNLDKALHYRKYFFYLFDRSFIKISCTHSFYK